MNNLLWVVARKKHSFMTLYNVTYHLKEMKQVRNLVFNSLCHDGNALPCLLKAKNQGLSSRGLWTNVFPQKQWIKCQINVTLVDWEEIWFYQNFRKKSVGYTLLCVSHSVTCSLVKLFWGIEGILSTVTTFRSHLNCYSWLDYTQLATS